MAEGGRVGREGKEGGGLARSAGRGEGEELVRECGMSEGGQTRKWGKFIRFVNLDNLGFVR